MKKLATTFLVAAVCLSLGLVSCSGDTAALEAEIASLTEQLEEYKRAEAQVEENLALMRSADESMNARDWETFSRVHAADVYVTSPDSPEPQTNMEVHLAVVKSFTDAFPDHEIQLPYKAVFGSGEWLCAVHENGGTFTEPWHLPGGQVIEPNGKSYTMTMVTVGRARDGELTEEMIIYDMSSMMRQLDLAGH